MAAILAELLNDGQESVGRHRFVSSDARGWQRERKERKECVAGSLPHWTGSPRWHPRRHSNDGHRGPISNFHFSGRNDNTKPGSVCSKLDMFQTRSPISKAT